MTAQGTLYSETLELLPELMTKLSRSVSFPTDPPPGYFLTVLFPSMQVGGWSVERLLGNL